MLTVRLDAVTQRLLSVRLVLSLKRTTVPDVDSEVLLLLPPLPLLPLPPPLLVVPPPLLLLLEDLARLLEPSSSPALVALMLTVRPDAATPRLLSVRPVPSLRRTTALDAVSVVLPSQVLPRLLLPLLLLPLLLLLLPHPLPLLVVPLLPALASPPVPNSSPVPVPMTPNATPDAAMPRLLSALPASSLRKVLAAVSVAPMLAPTPRLLTVAAAPLAPSSKNLMF